MPSLSSSRAWRALGFVGICAYGNAAQGQAPRDSAYACEGMIVDTVSVRTERPEFRGATAWWRNAARALGLHHETTSAGLIRRFVSLAVGRSCTEFRRAESERILRAQPYLSDARVTTTSHGGRIRVGVTTTDEVPVVASARVRETELRALTLGTMNFLGAGMHVESRWEQAPGLRHGFGGKMGHPQLLGRPYAIALDGMRRSLGEYYVVALQHPFYTDLQRVAWHSGYATSKDFARLRRQDRSELLQPVDRAVWSAGGVVRFGPPRKLGLLGGMLISERVVPRHVFSEVDSVTGRLIPATDTTGVRRYGTHDVTNVAGVVGVRALTYSRMLGLDALAAEQDVASGTQIGLMFGVRPNALAPLRESFASLDAYGAGRSPRNFVGARTQVESRVDLGRSVWTHIIGSGRAAWYYKVAPNWVSELSTEAAGAWKTTLPFQLELGDRVGGMRGYALSREAGGQRLIGRIEQRLDLARARAGTVALGAALFGEAGKVWAGDVPFGRETPVRADAGFAILVSLPASSQRTIRAEVALPFSHETGARAELRFTVREPTRGFWAEPPRIRSARLAVPQQVFVWP